LIKKIILTRLETSITVFQLLHTSRKLKISSDKKNISFVKCQVSMQFLFSLTW